MYELAAYFFLVSLLISGLITPLAARLGRRWGMVDLPGPRKVHSEPTPLTGGCALFISLTLVLGGHLLAATVIRGSSLEASLPSMIQGSLRLIPVLLPKLCLIYGGAAAIFVLGLIDDLRGITPRSRLLCQVAVAGTLASFGLRPGLDWLPAWVAFGIGILWIVGITNAFNFLDGLDGLSTGVAMVATLALLTIMGFSNQPDVGFFLAALSGIQLGFLRFNFHPARIFLGSSGSLLLGYLLSVCTLLATYTTGAHPNPLAHIFTPLFILAIPIYDTTSVVLIRLRQGRPIALGDQSHFHHRLMHIGLSHRQAVLFIIAIAFAVALSAVRLVETTFRQGLVILIQIAAILSILVLAERVALGKREKALQEQARTPAVPPVLQDSESPRPE